MDTRKFKPGDIVRHHKKGPAMQVLNYIFEYNPWVGHYRSDEQVECFWFEDGRRRARIFRQQVLKAAVAPTVLLPVSQEELRQREN